MDLEYIMPINCNFKYDENSEWLAGGGVDFEVGIMITEGVDLDYIIKNSYNSGLSIRLIIEYGLIISCDLSS